MSPVQLKRQGLHLSGTPLFLDATRKAELSFVSHAHADHIARHERVIATAPTVRFMVHRLGKLPAALPVPYHHVFELGSLTVELLPAGHILGSAQIRVIRPDGERIVYTGDLNLAPSLTAEAHRVAECDTLVIESTFGHPRYVFPPRAEVLGQVETWIRQCQARDVTPVLFGYPLGKSQEVIRYLTEKGFSLAVHASIAEMVDLYAELGVNVGKVRRFSGTPHPGEVVMYPPQLSRTTAITRIANRSTAVLTGWAMDPSRSRMCGADRAFAFSDHADFPSLVDYVKQTGAREVITVHGFARELAESLRGMGIQARAVNQALQLQLPLAG
jgi:putative mRNA 3-end processing factor